MAVPIPDYPYGSHESNPDSRAELNPGQFFSGTVPLNGSLFFRFGSVHSSIIGIGTHGTNGDVKIRRFRGSFPFLVQFSNDPVNPVEVPRWTEGGQDDIGFNHEDDYLEVYHEYGSNEVTLFADIPE
jgi:hypothetical protein